MALHDTGGSVVRRAANALRAIVFEKEDGEIIGSEDELLLKLGVSRPTLRQAAGLVAQEQWLVVKRGVGGGYFARRPDSRAVAHMAAVYLQAHNAGVEQIIHAVWPIRVELARLAAKNLDAESRQMLVDFLGNEEKLTAQPVDYRAFLKAERDFGNLLGQASANQVLALFLNILYDMASRVRRDDDIYAGHPERVEEYRNRRNVLIQAILDRDEQLAVLNASRIATRVTEWLADGLPADAKPATESVQSAWQPMLDAFNPETKAG